MNRFCFIILVLFIFPASYIVAQNNSLDFEIPNPLCFEQNFEVQNVSSNYDNIQFDFCEGDLSLLPTLATKVENELNVPIGTSLIQSNGKWYGFVCSMNDNAIFRLDFGASLTNKSPALIKLYNTTGLLNAPQDIKIIEYDGEFLAFVYNRGGNQLIRLNIGSSIENLNVTSDVLVTGKGFVNGGLDVIFDGKQWTACLTYSNYIRLINLGDSPKNIPSPSDIIFSSVFSEINGIGDINFVQDNGIWYGFLTGFGSRSIHRLDFGDSLFIEPIPHRLNSFELGALLQPYGLAVKKDKGEWHIFSTTGQGSMLHFNLGQDISNNTPTFSNLGNLGGLSATLKFDMANSSSRWVALTTSWNANRYHLIEFPQADCPFDLEYSDDESTSLKTLKRGVQYISLYGQDSKGIPEQITKEITVTNDRAPQINFATDNLCLGNPTSFTAQNLTPTQTLTTHTWDFGDGTTATGSEVSHQYTEPGTYKVRLTVESENGCGNFLEKEVNIYEAPAPDFSFPPGAVCTNGEISFTNTTPGAYKEEDITWHWDFGDGTSSEEKSPTHTYTTGGTKTVILTASIPGCTETQEYQVTVMEGPSVNFVEDHLCFGDVVQFTNLSSGDGITSFVWDFGNGETSTVENPVMEFEAAGEYEVSLTVSNAIGCSNTFTKTIKINALPAVSFENAMACTGAVTLFQDKSTVSNGSIAAWEWRFGDGGTSTERNPTHTFTEAGSYEVTLIVTSVAGCIDSVKQTVDVNLAPIADFEVELGCPGALTQFTNTSQDLAGDGIEVTYWIINGIYHYTPNPAVLFTKAGTYGVTLAVTSGSSCKSIVTKNIVVDPLPTPNFTFENACVGAATSFADQSIAFGDDEIAVWNWEFGNFETSTEQNPEVVFPGEGNYAVTLTVTTARGCSAIINKTVTINALPEAAFTPQSNFGAPPLEVKFSNNSTGAVSYQWHFGDAEGSTSTEAAPVFVYTEVGDYEVEMIATNAGGCSDTARFTVSVLISEVDVVLEKINVYTNTGNMQVVLSIRNQGTVPVENMNIKLDLGGKISLNERFSGSIAPGSSYNYPLGFDILAEDLPGVAYICASLEVAGIAKEEVNKQDNSACQDIKGTFLLTEPYPNPVDQTLNIEYFMPDDVPARFVLSDMLGNAVLDFQEGNAKRGLNKFNYDFSHLAAGMYVLQISHKETSYIRRLIVQ